MADRSCGTCRDRRILCDRTLPTCTRCARSNRICKGYALRLSWPKTNDSRRAIIGKPPLQGRKARRFFDARVVGVSSWDIEMHYFLSGVPPSDHSRLALRIPDPFDPFIFDVGDNDLFQYFQHTASRSLTTFGHKPIDVGNVIIRMAMTYKTPSAGAVLKSMLALSSLHRNGLQTQAFGLKISALKALGAAAKGEIGTTEAIQHVAAGMLLCSFEIHQASCTSGQWEWYICGVKDVIRATSLGESQYDSDLTILTDWVHYHDVLARFSLGHWHKGMKPRPSQSSLFMEILHATPSPYATLELLSIVSDVVTGRSVHTASGKSLTNAKYMLMLLEQRITDIAIPGAVGDNSTATMLELFQLAILVYLDRASGGLLEQPGKTRQRIKRAFSIFSEMSSCERQFPLFVLGCEAQTDAERIIVLDLISRTEQQASSRSLALVTRLIQAIWVQDDLASREIDYLEKLNAIIGFCTILPTFV